MYCVHGTAVWKPRPRSDWLPLLSRSSESRAETRGKLGGRAGPQTTQLTACQTDKQWQATDTFLQTEADVWTAAVAGGGTSCCLWGLLVKFFFFILMSLTKGQIQPAVLKWYLFPRSTKTILCIPFNELKKTVAECNYTMFWIRSYPDVDGIFTQSLKNLSTLRNKTGLILTWVEMCHTLISSYNSCSSVFIPRSFQTIKHCI